MKPYNLTETKNVQVHRMFNNIAPYYDKICHILSFNIDKVWRTKLVEFVAQREPKSIIDIATGTGDVAIKMAIKLPQAKVTGIDISEEMLKIAQRKICNTSLESQITLLCNDAENISFENDYFDIATISFGIRNFENIDKGLMESLRVLKRGGCLFIMEFSTPKNKIFNAMYRFYSNTTLLIIGKLISNDDKAYKYLPESIAEFTCESEFLNRLKNQGFVNCESYSLLNGIAYIYIGNKP